ncbi:10896_t:CDS:2 [Entrophospora sp. SA101]|nr:10896_t:CDS:2 [Entrophospora sp. SA101]
MKPSIEREKVLVDLFVMSRCPDAVVCELKEVNDIAIITTDYVANLNDSEKYGVTCKHGELECIECLNQDISLIGTYNHAKKCTNQVLGVTAATTVNITNSADDNYSKVDKCVNSKEGRTLLMKSVLKTTMYNVTKSCTMFINQKLRCIRDGYWYDCDEGHSVEDFVQSIRKAYEKGLSEQPIRGSNW